MRRLVYLVFVLVSLSVDVSCIDRPEYVLDEPEMIDVLVDVHRAEGLLEVQHHPNTSSREVDKFQQAVMAAVLQKHKISKAQYDSSLMWYAQNLKLLARVYSHVEERLEAETEMWTQQVADSREFGESMAGDTVDLWTLRRHLVLDPKRHSSIRLWEVPSDSNYVDGDRLAWHFHVAQLLPGQQLIASIALTPTEPTDEQRREANHANSKIVLIETDEPVGYATRTIRSNGDYTLSVEADSIQPFKSTILGLVLMQDSVMSAPVFIDSISLIRTHLW